MTFRRSPDAAQWELPDNFVMQPTIGAAIERRSVCLAGSAGHKVSTTADRNCRQARLRSRAPRPITDARRAGSLLPRKRHALQPETLAAGLQPLLQRADRRILDREVATAALSERIMKTGSIRTDAKPRGEAETQSVANSLSASARRGVKERYGIS